MRTSKLASAASRAAATRSGRETVPNSGPMRMAGALLRGVVALAFEVAAFGADVFAGPTDERGEGDAVFLVRLLDAGEAEVFEDDGGEVGRAGEAGFAFVLGDLPAVNDVVVFVHGEDAMGRDAFDGEGTGDADLGLVVVGFVVEKFKLGLGGDGGVYFLLAGDAGFPPGGVELRGCFGPRVDGCSGRRFGGVGALEVVVEGAQGFP